MNKEITPTITYIMIETNNKSNQQLIDEVVDRVNKICNNKLLEYKGKIDNIHYKLVESDIEKEKDRMIKQFIYQILNLEEIKELGKEI